MPRLNKLQVRVLVRNLIDDRAGKLWQTSELDLLIEGALDELWGELLDQWPYLRSTELTLTPTAPGYIDTSDSTVFLSRFYRVQQVVRDNTAYSLVPTSEIVVANGVALVTEAGTCAFLGSQLHLFPYSTSTVYLRYVSLPEPFTSLSPGPDPDSTADDDISFVDWPDGYHMAYIYDVASKAIEKGNREESAQLQKRAEMSMFRLKAFLRKQHGKPITVGKGDLSEGDWGSI